MSARAASTLLLAAAAVAACGGSSKPPVACDERAVVSLVLVVKDADGRPVAGAAGRWAAGDRSDACQASAGELQCGWEAAGALSVVVSAPGYASRTVTADIERGECHVEPQRLEVILERAAAFFAEERRYAHAFHPTQAECDAAPGPGGIENCCATARFGADGSAEVMVTDIMNPGTYVLDAGAIVFTRGAPGDVPATLRFALGADDALTDDAQQWRWERRASAACY